MIPPKVLYVPNELDDFRQVGLRRPLANLLNAGFLSDVRIYSLKWRLQQYSGAAQQRDGLIRLAKDFEPDIVIMQHLGGTGLRARHFKRLRDVTSSWFIYHEADPYLRPLHPLPKEARLAGRYADIVYTVGTGSFARAFRDSGARNVHWEPSPFDPERYRFPDIERSIRRPFDVVIIANRNRPRIRGLPGWRDRVRFVELMQEHFGPRLGVFGNGWKGATAMGPVAFANQTDAIQLGMISANWDHFAAEPSYFSNRLPISLATGGIHATTRHPEYDHIFGDALDQFLIVRSTPEDLVDAVDRRLSTMTLDEWYESAVRARRFAHRHFRQDDQLVRFLNSEALVVTPTQARAVWTETAPPLNEC